MATIEAVTPKPPELMAASSPANVLSEEAIVSICAVPEPTVKEIEPESVSLAALAIGLRLPAVVELLV